MSCEETGCVQPRRKKVFKEAHLELIRVCEEVGGETDPGPSERCMLKEQRQKVRGGIRCLDWK